MTLAKEAESTNSKRSKVHYDEIVRSSSVFDEYYKRQGLFENDAESWDEMIKSFVSPLPTTFRITGHRKQAEATRKYILDNFVSVFENGILRELPWYEPKGMGWHIDIDRKILRTTDAYKEFHQWLVAATENGDISRQEAVSMIPPIFLAPKADDRVLDMCAAPGSKTTQLIEFLHKDASENVSPKGMVVANDSDQQRSYMLYHQVKRVLSPSLLVTNNDGCHFGMPKDCMGNSMPFDKILVDVPCSGDGTLRKNPMLWKRWTPSHAIGLHPLQVRLLEKAIRLLKVGGKLVYSTCSLNHIENEAVIAHILLKYKESLSLLDVSDQCKDLIRRPGLSSWKVFAKGGEELLDFSKVPADQQKKYPESMFSKPEYSDISLENSMRVYPHLQNTGGFFIAVIEKHSPLFNESVGLIEEEKVGSTKSKNSNTKKKGKFTFTAPDDFKFLDLSNDTCLANIFEWFGINEDDILNAGYGFLTRNDKKPFKAVTMVSHSLQSLFKATVDSLEVDNREKYNQSLKIVNAGIRVFEIYESNREIPVKCLYRMLSESVDILFPFMDDSRKMLISAVDMISLLKSLDSVKIDSIENAFSQGCLVVYYKDIIVPVWISERGVKAFIPSQNRSAMLTQIENYLK